MGNYATPMVTIELKEYNDLLKTKEAFGLGLHLSKEDVNPYKKAIGAMLSTILDLECDKDGLLFERVVNAPNRVDVSTSFARLQRGGDAWDVHCEPKFKNNGQR